MDLAWLRRGFTAEAPVDELRGPGEERAFRGPALSLTEQPSAAAIPAARGGEPEKTTVFLARHVLQ